MALVRYNPFNDLGKLSREFSSLWPSNWDLQAVFSDNLTLDLYEEDSKLVAEINLSNFKKDEIKITTDEGTLEISAERNKRDEDLNQRHYYFRESSDRIFRRVNLPEGVISEQAEAKFSNGRLKITMPIVIKSKPQIVEIK